MIYKTFYTLHDPVTEEIKFLGMTSKPLQVEINDLVAEAMACKGDGCPKCNWIKEILNTNRKPLINMIKQIQIASEDMAKNELKKLEKQYFPAPVEPEEEPEVVDFVDQEADVQPEPAPVKKTRTRKKKSE